MGEVDAKRELRLAAASGRLGHLLREVLGEWGVVQLVGRLEPWQVCELAGHRERIRVVLENAEGASYEGLGEWGCDVCEWSMTRVRRWTADTAFGEGRGIYANEDGLYFNEQPLT